MKVTYRLLISDLLPAFTHLSKLQQQGIVVLPNVVADGLNRNYRLLKQLLDPQSQREMEILKKHVLTQSKMSMISFKTVGQGTDTDFDYIKTMPEGQVVIGDGIHAANSDFHRDLCTKEMEALKDELVDWIPVKVHEDEIAKVHNFPMNVYNSLSAFEIITTLAVSKNNILQMHK